MWLDDGMEITRRCKCQEKRQIPCDGHCTEAQTNTSLSACMNGWFRGSVHVQAQPILLCIDQSEASR